MSYSFLNYFFVTFTLHLKILVRLGKIIRTYFILILKFLCQRSVSPFLHYALLEAT